jgi:predicted FMN-binding regulatory protein PaiB
MRVLTYTCPWPGNLVEKNEDKHVLIQHFANANSSLSLSLLCYS